MIELIFIRILFLKQMLNQRRSYTIDVLTLKLSVSLAGYPAAMVTGYVKKWKQPVYQ